MASFFASVSPSTATASLFTYEMDILGDTLARKRSRQLVTLGLAKLMVDTIGRTLAINKANGLLDALPDKLTQLTQALTDY